MSEHEHTMKATGGYYTPLECDECDFALSSNGLEELYLSERAAVVRMNQAEDAMARMMDEKAALEAKLSKMEEALYKAAEKYGEVGAPEVHRVWQKTMIATGRHVRDELLDWRGLPAQDVRLDERIAQAVAKDFLIWAFGHKEALAGGEEA